MAGRYVTRSELNSSLTRIEARVNETNKIIREQNAQFAILLGQEADKREDWCGHHDEEHKEIADGIGKRTSHIAWWITGLAITALGGVAGMFILYFLSHH